MNAGIVFKGQIVTTLYKDGNVTVEKSDKSKHVWTCSKDFMKVWVDAELRVWMMPSGSDSFL